MRAIIRFLVERPLLINLVSVFLLVLGLVTSIYLINREAFPNVNLDKIQIDAVYPGASPREVEQLIITPIEQELRSLNGIDTMVSMSFPGSGRIVMEVDPYASNRDKLSNEITLAVDRADLPADLPDPPVVTEIDGAVFPIIRMAVAAPLDDLHLKRLGDKIKDDLLNLKGIARVQVLSDRKAELRVTVDPEKMAAKRISVSDVANAISSWNMNTPGGEIDTPDGQKSVRMVGEFRDPRDAASLVLRANDMGNDVTLGDVATVTESLEKPRIIYEVKGKPAISMLILKKADADIINTVDTLKDYIKTMPARYGKDIEVDTFQDFSHFTRLRLGVFLKIAKGGNALVATVGAFPTV